MAKYHRAFIFTKKGNLLPWLRYQNVITVGQNSPAREYYAKERDIELVAMFRWERSADGYKCFCKIKCPVNPLPIKGEFECSNIGIVTTWLRNEGWSFKQKLYPNMFD